MQSPRFNSQSSSPTYGQLFSQTLQEFSPFVNNNASEVVPVKVEAEDSFSAPALEEKQQENDLDHQLDQRNREEVEQDLHEYSRKITEGENFGKFRCNLCGKISPKRKDSFQHVESIHFPGSYEYQCDQCDEKFDTKCRWRFHRTTVHSKSRKMSK